MSVRRVRRGAAWLALALLVLAGGECVAILSERALGIRRYADLTPLTLLAVMTVRSVAEVGLAPEAVLARTPSLQE